LLASSSASSTYVQYVSGASFLPPRYPLKAKWYHPPRQTHRAKSVGYPGRRYNYWGNYNNDYRLEIVSFNRS
jgi:hypothetical protein